MGSNPTVGTIMKLLLCKNTYPKEFLFSVPDVPRIGVIFSGGLDSLTLMSLILQELKNQSRLNSTTVKAYTFKKFDDAPRYAARLIDLISSRFSVQIEHENFMDNDGYHQGRVGSQSYNALYSRREVDVIYWGFNNTAPDNVRPFPQKLKINYGTEKQWENNSYVKAPFLTLYKPQIFDILLQLGFQDIVPYTHSCCVLASENCNECYSCVERKWATDTCQFQDSFIPLEE